MSILRMKVRSVVPRDAFDHRSSTIVSGDGIGGVFFEVEAFPGNTI